MTAVAVVALLASSPAAAQNATTRIGEGYDPAVSADGRWVAFTSSADTLVAGDTNQREDIFVYDRQTGAITRVSVGPGGTEANNDSSNPSISGDGRRVAFLSSATNLVAGDTNQTADVFVHDRHTGTTTLVSSNGFFSAVHGAPTISADGLVVAFTSDASFLVPGDSNYVADVFVRELQSGAITRVSVDAGGTEANQFSGPLYPGPFVSADGRFVAFASYATNLVPGDTNDNPDVFVRDRQAGTTTRVSIGPGGAQANGFSWNPAVSADGRFVIFASDADNLVGGDTNASTDLFAHDFQTGVTTRVNVGPVNATVEINRFLRTVAVSGDGRWVAFESSSPNLVVGDTNNNPDVFLHDRSAGTTTLASFGADGGPANGTSEWAAISGDGRVVAFVSSSTNLVPGGTTGARDVFIHDRGAGAPPVANGDVYAATFSAPLAIAAPGVLANDFDNGGSGLTAALVSGPFFGTVVLATNGAFTYTPALGAPGVDAFTYRATTSNGVSTAATVSISLFDPFTVPQLVSGEMTNGNVSGGSRSWMPAVSGTGRYVAFVSRATNLVAGDTNGFDDVFVFDRQTGATTRVNIGPGGVQANAGGSWRRPPVISADGRFVAFSAFADNLVVGDTNGFEDVFVHDRVTGVTSLVSVGPGGIQGNFYSWSPAISADGRFVAFRSYADNLVPGDTNIASDVFVRDRQTGTTTRVSVGPGGTQATGRQTELMGAPSISGDGRFVAFASRATNLVTGDTNGGGDVFVHDMHTGATTRVSVGPGGAQAEGDFKEDDLAMISLDGRFVAFSSGATDLVAADTNNRQDVFVHDRHTGTTTRASVATGGLQGNGFSGEPTISADGQWVAFTSSSTNLAADTNGQDDIFLHDRHTGSTSRVNVRPGGGQSSGGAYWSALSATGRVVVFESSASDLVASDTNNTGDVFAYDRGLPPIAVAMHDTFSTAFATPLSVPAPGVLGNDVGEGTLTATVGTTVSHGTLTLTATGGFTYTPAPGFSGTDSFTYAVAVSNGTGTVPGELSNLVTVTLTVGPATTVQPPTALHVASVVGNTVTFRWTPPTVGPAATGYLLEAGLGAGEVIASLPLGAVPSFTIAVPRGSFFVRLHAVSGPDKSAASNEIPLHIDMPVPPSPPAHLLGTVAGTSLTLAWTNTFAGAAPTGLLLDVGGAVTASIPIGLADSFVRDGVPAGTYTLRLRGANAAGASAPSNAVTLTFPGGCSGAPLPPADFLPYAVGRTVFLTWATAASGPAPNGFVLEVSGALVGAFPATGRRLSGAVPPGTYHFRLQAANACGMSAYTPLHTVVVP